MKRTLSALLLALAPLPLALPACSAAPEPASGASTTQAIDASTLDHKLLWGYQGWFTTEGDGARGEWTHWAAAQRPAAGNVTFDAWPDTSELDADELHDTDLAYPGGRTARLFSSAHPKTVRRHFEWMAEHGIDGVHLQRFLGELSDPRVRSFRDRVTLNVLRAAEATGRVVALMYDISGANGAALEDDLESDWHHLVDDLHVTDSPSYLHHEGRPVLGVWGFGFSDRPGTPAQAHAVQLRLGPQAPPRYRTTTIGGVPSRWRALTEDAKGDPQWAQVHRGWDVISPWLVGRYMDEAGVDAWRKQFVEPDLAAAKQAGRAYLPVVFPGFSFANKEKMPFNQVPRLGGRFLWKQLHAFQSAGCTMFFGAMFDEVDEGTAIFKIASRAGDAAEGARFLTLDADGESLPTDHYLFLAGQGARMLRGEIGLSPSWPARQAQPPPPPPPPNGDPPPDGATFWVQRTLNPQSSDRSVAFPGWSEAGWNVEGPVFRAYAEGGPGLRPIHLCKRGGDRYVSLDAACEGGTVLHASFAWVLAADGEGRRAIRRCHTGSDLFASQEPGCEGAQVDGIQGWFEP